MLRGERQLRPPGLSGSACAAHRHARPGRGPRLGLRQLRSALGHDVAAGTHQRSAERRGAHRRRALRRRALRGGRRGGARGARHLLERIEDAATGVVKPAAFHAQIPLERSEQAKRAAEVLGEEIWRRFPFVKGMKPMTSDLADLVLNRTWRPMLAVTGAEGLPAPANAGNVLRPKTALVLSLRLPPTVRADSAARQLQRSEEHTSE